MTYQIEKLDATTKKIISICYPEYKGKKVYLSTNIPKQLNSYWDGGSKEYYVFYELSTGKTFPVNSNHPMFERNNERDLEKLPDGIIIVNKRSFQGKEIGITLYANEKDFAPMLPQPEPLTEVEEIVLASTCKKNSYAGETDLRFKSANRQFKMHRFEWDKAQENLIKRGLLRKNKSLSPKGRNAIINTRINIY